MNQANQTAMAGKNRIMDVVLLYAEMEAEHRVNNPTMRKDGQQALAMRANQYQNILAGYRKMKGLTREEKNTRSFVTYELRRIKAQMNPTLLNRFLDSRPIRSFLNFMDGQYQNQSLHVKALTGFEKNATIDMNVAALIEKMRGAGFKDHIEGDLKKMLQHNNLPAFSLRYFDKQKPDADYVLHFKKIPGTDVFYFEKYDVSIRPDLDAVLKGQSSTQHLTVSMTNGPALNAEEARRLASDHAIEKKKDGVSVWLVRDRASHTGLREVSFALETALKAWPIKEVLSDSERPALLKALATGREQEITFITDKGTAERLTVSVGPSLNGGSLQLYFRTPEGKLVDPSRIQSGDTAQNNVLQMMQSLAVKQNNKLNPFQRLFKLR